MQSLSDKIKRWLEAQVPSKAIDEIHALFTEGVSKKKTAEDKKLEDKFKPDNFDLITWFVVSN